MKFISENQIEGEMDDKDFSSKIEAITKERENKPELGRDGDINSYSEEFVYKKIPYEITIYRYFKIGVPIGKIDFSINTIGKWAQLYYPEKIKNFVRTINELYSLIKSYSDDYFLHEDTLHSHQEEWTLKQMVDDLHKTAKEQIDSLDDLILNFLKMIENKIKHFNESFKVFDTELKTIKKV